MGGAHRNGVIIIIACKARGDFVLVLIRELFIYLFIFIIFCLETSFFGYPLLGVRGGNLHPL